MVRGLAAACVTLLAALAGSGCGAVGLSEAGEGNASSGKTLFTQKCGSCHTLADAGTKGQIGPNLDNAFLQSRADGLGERTIQSVVRGQIEYPIEEPGTGLPGMPGPDTLLPECEDASEGERGCVADQDGAAEDIAAYVASVAGLPTTGIAPAAGADPSGSTPKTGAGGAPDGEAIFAKAGCGGCHTLKAAGAAGNVGPSLDDSKPEKKLVIDRVTNGKGSMPAFADSYTPDEIAAVAEYVVSVSGG